jgi:CO/xanthine dehydrogenase Mo-binding subunit
MGGVPAGLEPGLEATSRFEPGNATFPFGTHICVVEVDPDTGAFEIKRFVAVDDCGNVINPLIVDGQVHGGVAQGLAQTLYEEVVYDENGQLLTRRYRFGGQGPEPTLESNPCRQPARSILLARKAVAKRDHRRWSR